MCCQHESVRVRLPPVLPVQQSVKREDPLRYVGSDGHRDFCELAIVEGGEVRPVGRIQTTPEALEVFAGSLGRDDRVVLEVAGNAWEVARIIEPHMARVVVVIATDTGIRQGRAKVAPRTLRSRATSTPPAIR